MFVLLAFAFLAGIVTILSPCILPLLPIILAGSATGGRSRPIGIVIGFMMSFTIFTLFALAIIRLLGIPADALRTAAIVIIALFGLALIVPKLNNAAKKGFGRLANAGIHRQTESSGGILGGFIIGLSLGLVWSPCVGPIMASVITLAATESVTFQAVLITFAYSLGTAIPMFAIMAGGRRLIQQNAWLLENTEKIQKIFGVVMILIAIAMMFGIDRRFQAYILDYIPNYANTLTTFEKAGPVQDKIDMISGSGSTIEDAKNNSDFAKAPNPAFEGATKWLGSEPLTLEKLKGKVVLIDFWTYSCINCIRTLPYLTSWDQKYRDQGLVVIGVHSPEFAFENIEKNVLAAMKQYNIQYPVVQDNDFAIWKSYDNHYWPAKYLIDADGNIRDMHFGEGAYMETEQKIIQLLKEAGQKVSQGEDSLSQGTITEELRYGKITPETYLGSQRMERFVSPEKVVVGEFTNYTIPETVPADYFGYQGSWNVEKEKATARAGSSLTLVSQAKKVFLVMRSDTPDAKVKVYVDNQPIPVQISNEDVKDGIITINEDRLYKVLQLNQTEQHRLRFEFQTDGIEVYAFTFG